jgi:diacylglycerol O-acyltransferase
MPTPPVHRRSTTVWGVGAELSPFETVLWRAESDRSLRSSLLVIEQLDAEPAWDRLVAAHERLVARVPRLRQRIVEAPLDLGYPWWSPDRHFDLRQHLWRARLPVGVPGGCGWPGLLAAAARLAMAPVDRTRPPWEAVLFEGLPDGRAAYLLKIHHALTDGLGAVQLLEQLHVRTIDGDPAPAGDVRASAPQESPLGVLAHQVRSDVTAVPGLLRTAGSGALGALSNPRGALRSAGRYGSSLRRLAANMQVAPSPCSPAGASRAGSSHWR